MDKAELDARDILDGVLLDSAIEWRILVKEIANALRKRDAEIERIKAEFALLQKRSDRFVEEAFRIINEK